MRQHFVSRTSLTLLENSTTNCNCCLLITDA